MTRAYVLDGSTLAIVGLVDQSWEKLKYTRRYFGMDTFEMSINRSRLYASELQKGRLLYLPDEGDRVFLIEQIQSTQEGSTANDEMLVSGRSMEGIAMAERLVEPDPGQAYDKQTAQPAETAIKHYVRKHAADLAGVNRQIPNLVVAADAATGDSVTVSGRYQYVFDVVREIGLATGIGWEILLDPALGQFVFDIITGVDRSASVFFDFAFETLEKWEELDSILESKTVAVVAGQGEGAAREIVKRYPGGIEPTGMDRREVFLDARDVEVGDTATLDTRGDSYLEAASAETRLEATIHQYGSFRYGTHWDMGDLVLIRNEERGISYTARVVEVEKSFDASMSAPVVTAIIDRPFPTLKEQVQGAGAKGGVVDYPLNAGATGVVSIWPAAAGSIPSGYLLCDGASYLRADYPDLFAIIGTTFGAVDGTHFNVPNLKGRMVVGLDAAQVEFDTLAETGGAKTQTPSAHSVTQPSAHSNHVVTQPSAHTVTQPADHAAQVHSAHTGGAVSAHAVHTHETPFIDDDTHTLSTTSAVFGQGASRTRVWTGSFSSASGSYPVAQVSDTTVGAHTFTQPSAHSDHAALAHSGTAVSAHAGTAVDAHSAHTGTAVAAHSALSVLPPYMALNFIIKA